MDNVARFMKALGRLSATAGSRSAEQSPVLRALSVFQ